ncbi:MAG: NAD-dependent epimerase/dehydratase family protein [Spirochaetia bacterium]|nr:NAD-dependent epimerase/dehydratase family protein [Spirochaetia bacterium]
MQTKSVLMVGATGLVGRQFLQLLLLNKRFHKVIVLGRKKTGLADPKLEEHEVDLLHLEPHKKLLRADVVVSCIGTTIKTAGSREAFSAVDLGIPDQLARLAYQNGARQCLVISSSGANVKSPFFYTRVKGQMEASVSAHAFSSVGIFRPSLLLGIRDRPRFGEAFAEKILGAFGWLLVGPLKKYRAIHASVVARAMVNAAHEGRPGVAIYESDQIVDLAEQRHWY